METNLHTHLISGAGNTFHIVWKQDFKTSELRKNIAKKICADHPADGFIFLDWALEASHKLKWHFYNNDGSDAEMCGNATRCVGFYATNVLKIPEKNLKLETIAGEIQIQVIDPQSFQVRMTGLIKKNHPLYFYCDTGVPHLVIESPSLSNYREKLEFCRALRQHPDFAPQGTNVTLVELLPHIDQLKAVSYERGVEDFTSACGTGAMAAAFYNLTKRNSIQTQVEMPGGLLMMNLADLEKPIMTGPAVLLGEYDNELKY